MLGFQLIKHRRAKALLVIHLSRRHPHLSLLYHPENLRFGGAAFQHPSASVGMGIFCFGLSALQGWIRAAVLPFKGHK